jgi:hypothetical protein
MCAALVVQMLACAVCWHVLQDTLDSFEVRCCASQRLHQARCGVHCCVQAAATAHIADEFEEDGDEIVFDGARLLCHLIVDADFVNQEEWMKFPPTPTPTLPLMHFHHFHAASWFLCFSSEIALHCICLLSMATLNFAVFCCSATLI